METSKTKELDSILFYAGLANYAFLATRYDKDQLISDYVGEHTDYFDFYQNESRHYKDCQSLELEIRDWFLDQKDSKLQDRFANYLVDTLFDKIYPLYANTSSWYENVEFDMGRSQGTKKGEIWIANGMLCNSISDLVSKWMDAIRSNVKIFAPEIYKKHSFKLDQLLPIYDEEGEEIEFPTETQDPNPQPTEPGVKLQWKGDKTDLAELVWTLAKSGRVTDTSTGKDVTQEQLTAQLAALFGISDLNVKGLMQGRKRSTKAAEDGITFTSSLAELVDTYTASK